jgi:6,7-dimethyl-8-ribityllumazine synthase
LIHATARAQWRVMSRPVPSEFKYKLPKDAKVAIVAARFNAHIVDVLLVGCAEELRAAGAADSDIVIHRVPGAFELPLAAKWLAESGQFAAVVCLGCVIRGETPHFDFVAGECARGVMEVSLETGVPVVFGVLTTNNEQQSLDRAGGSHSHAGRNAADAALEMIHVREVIRG